MKEVDADIMGLWDALKIKYEKYSQEGLDINIERGWPCSEQLDLSMSMLDIVTSKDNLRLEVDYRGYAGTGGIAPAKELFSQMLDVGTDEIYIAGTMSTTIMYDIISKAFLIGFMGDKPWKEYEEIKFICPSPGYEKHFKICETFGIKMIPVKMFADGPDMDEVENIVRSDETVKGIWCVPLYSNPTGAIYSDNVVRRLANMPVKASDFKIFWDNAYCVHHLTDNVSSVLNILEECKQAENCFRPLIFASTSKMTFPGGGIAMCAACHEMIQWIKEKSLLQLKTGDKINQLRHVRFFESIQGIYAHMERHRRIIAPKFDLVNDILERNFRNGEIVTWIKPKGGYFFCIELLPQMAHSVWEICKNVGVSFTPAGSIFPYGYDPEDKFIRIAPTYASMEDLEKAVDILSCAIKMIYLNNQYEIEEL